MFFQKPEQPRFQALSKGWPLLGVGAVITVALLGGCQQGGGGTETAATTSGDSALIAAGKAVYDANNCANCHSISGQGGKRAPDLSHTAAEATHTAQWLMDHVKDPKTHNPGSRMPAFGDKIKDKDLQALGAYLASLK